MADTKLKLKIKGMHCGSCAMDIDGELEDTDGVREAKTSYAKQQTEVFFDLEKINPKQIISIINKLDYEAEVQEL